MRIVQDNKKLFFFWQNMTLKKPKFFFNPEFKKNWSLLKKTPSLEKSFLSQAKPLLQRKKLKIKPQT